MKTQEKNFTALYPGWILFFFQVLSGIHLEILLLHGKDNSGPFLALSFISKHLLTYAVEQAAKLKATEVQMPILNNCPCPRPFPKVLIGEEGEAGKGHLCCPLQEPSWVLESWA